MPRKFDPQSHEPSNIDLEVGALRSLLLKPRAVSAASVDALGARESTTTPTAEKSTVRVSCAGDSVDTPMISREEKS